MFVFLTIGSLLIIAFLLLRRTFRGNLKAGIISCGIVSVIAAGLLIYNTIAAAMIFMVLSFLYAVIEILRFITKDRLPKVIPPVIAVILTTIYFAHAIYVASSIVTIRYKIDLGSDLRIAQISDTHIGNCFSVDDLRECVETINSYEPDLVVITGDLIDENTTRQEMKDTCKILSELRSKYGTYYIQGNHEKVWGINKNVKKGYPSFVTELKKNNVNVLEDRAVEIGDDYVLIGRKDEGDSSRKTLEKIIAISKIDTTGKKVIVLDHRPHYLKNISESTGVKVDLMLSGHTHGGQIFPVNVVYKLLSRPGDMVYGMSKINDTYFIVSSGASSGMVPMKNMVRNEIVIIDIQ